MTHVNSLRKSIRGRAANTLAAWLVPTVLFIGGLPAAALIGGTFGRLSLAGITDAAAPEHPTTPMTIGAPAPEVLRIEATAPATADGRKSFAFGYLEFDWDPDAPGGVPGFDSRPS